MSEDLRDLLFRYYESLPDESPLKEITKRTVYELGRENPFDRMNNKSGIRELNIGDLKSGKRYDYLTNAINDLGLPEHMIRYEINQVLKNYGLKLL